MAQRLQHKRSSIQGRRPADQYLEPGELALNTNQNDPGLFFETNTGDIAKAGPTAIGLTPPESEVGYGPGEAWYDTGNGTQNIWVPALNRWVPMLSPLFGGARTAIFVGSEFPEASDDLSNDGVARPFASLNRAMLEVARRSVLAGRDDEVFNARFTVILLPGRNVVYNEPGISLSTFESSVQAFVRDQQLTQETLRLFNSSTGGLLVPRGTSIVGLDLRKTVLVPTYYPKWSRDTYTSEPTLIAPRTSMMKWTGNCLYTSLTFKDKIADHSVVNILGDSDQPAVLHTLRPHSFRSLVTADDNDTEIVSGDLISMTYPEGVSRDYDGVPTLPEEDFYAEPLDPFSFRLRKFSTGEIVLRNELPKVGVPGASPASYLNFTYSNSTHHRLSVIGFSTSQELNEYYSKVQRAFASLNFSGTSNNAEVASGETIIVSQTPDLPNVAIDSVKNGSPYLYNISIRSDWGLSGLAVDGSLVNGFKSALCCNFTSVSLQSDANVYEVYEDGEWISLKQSYVNAQNVGSVDPIGLSDVTNEEAITFLLTNIKLENIRYFYRTAEDIPGENGKSSGLPDDRSDTRHFVVKASNGGYGQTVASFAIGVAINYWATSGASISVTNANSNFGGIALRAEGFAGIGTAGGAEEPDTGFTVQGIRRPSAITRQMVLDPDNIKRFYVNSRVVSVTPTSITFAEPINTTALQPFTLRYGTRIWAEDFNTGSEYSAQLVSGGTVISGDGLTIYVINGTNGFVNPGTPSIPAVPASLAITALDDTSLTGGSGYLDGAYTGVPLTGGTGTGATANINITAGAVDSVVLVSGGSGYTVGDTLSATDLDLGGNGGSGFDIDVLTVDTTVTPAVPGTPAGGLISEQLSLPYIRRFQDPRPIVDRTYSLWVRNTSQSHRAPEVGAVLRFAEKPASGVSNLLVPGRQLDPGQKGGWGHLFQVIDVRTKEEGDDPNLPEPLITPTVGTSDYYVAIAPVDQFRPWVPAGNNGFSEETAQYPAGFYASYSDRVFYAQSNDLVTDSASKPVPVNTESVWSQAKVYEYCQPISSTWLFASGYDAAGDPFTPSYSGENQTFCYPRGLQFDKTNLGLQFAIDSDSGAADLGITSGGLVPAASSDPWWSPTKMAMTRFLALLGYTYPQIGAVLQPQLWSSRNLPVSSLPAVSGGGYALSTGTWPIEFNRPSTIRCGNHTWEWCGYLNYAKGLPKYQQSQLSLRQRFDFISNEIWGGVVYANGNAERGEFVLTGKTVAGGTGVTILTTDDPSPQFNTQDVLG